MEQLCPQKAETREFMLMEQDIATPRSERSVSTTRSSNLDDEQVLQRLRAKVDESSHTAAPASAHKQYRCM